jgi:ABC-type transport system involved in multi-copper enzyme maturation permease subunit
MAGAWIRSLWDPNPIMVKELRSYTREGRFFLMHMTLTIVSCLIVLWVTASAHEMYGAGVEGYDAASLGRRLYGTMQVALLLAVAIIVPGFCASAVSAEKDRGTFDLLIGCAVDPNRIVAGKFLAAMAVVAVMTAGVLPLLALAFYFGGVSAVHVAMFAATLFLFAALLASCVIYVSSIFDSSTWATLSAYLSSAFIGLCFGAFLHVIAQVDVVRDFYGIEATGQGNVRDGFGLGMFLLGWGVPVAFSVWLTAFFFTAAAAVLDRLPAYRLGATHRMFKWVRETGLALLAGVGVVSFVLACMGA